MFSPTLFDVGLPVLQLDGAWAALVVPASRLENEPRRRRLATGLGALDAQLGGGWPAASLSEIAGRRSTGRTSVLYASLSSAIGRGHTVALVDAAGVFDPRSAEAAGVKLSRLLWIRAAGRTVLQATDLLVAAGGFGLVAVDLGERPARVPDAAWLRLRHAAERQGTAVVVATPWRIVGAVAAAAVIMHGAMPNFVNAGGPLLAGLETRASVERVVGISPPPANEQLICFQTIVREGVSPLADSPRRPPTPAWQSHASRCLDPLATLAPALPSPLQKPVSDGS